MTFEGATNLSIAPEYCMISTLYWVRPQPLTYMVEIVWIGLDWQAGRNDAGALTASIIATIAILVGSKLHDEVDVVYREAIGDVIMWDTQVIKSNDDWPSRKKHVQKRCSTAEKT